MLMLMLMLMLILVPILILILSSLSSINIAPITTLHQISHPLQQGLA